MKVKDLFVRIKDLKKGELFKLDKHSSVVFVRGDYDRSSKSYECYKFDDVNSFRSFKGDRFIFIDFEF